MPLWDWTKSKSTHLTTYKGIGRRDDQVDVHQKLGKPDQSRWLQNGDLFEYYFDET